MKKTLSLLVLGILSVAGVASAESATWTFDTAHSGVGFGVKHMMLTTVRGQFNTFEGKVTTEGEDPTTAKIEVTVDVASVDTREAKRDEHLRSADFFDAANHPKMTFVSSKVEKGADGLQIVGDLTIRGVTREVVLFVEELTPTITDPWGNTRIGAHATGEINRKEFGVSWSKVMDNGGLVVSDTVTISLDVELIKQKPAAN